MPLHEAYFLTLCAWRAEGEKDAPPIVLSLLLPELWTGKRGAGF